MIHQTAVIDPSARIADDVSIGPYSIIGANVEIGAGTWIGPHVVITGPTVIGKQNKIYQFASLGEDSQDKKYVGQRAYLKIGDRNIIREFCTFNRGTQEEAATIIGNDNLFMAYVHIAHDCIVGNHTIFANNASLAGHVIVDDYAILSGFSGVFQFCRVGEYSFAAANSVIIKDVPPYIKVAGHHAKPFGLNSVGLQRHGFSDEIITNLRRAYKIIYRNGNTVAQAVSELQKMAIPEVHRLMDFITASKAGIIR